MSLKQYKPNTPGQRGLVLVGRESLHKGKPLKNLLKVWLKMVVEIILGILPQESKVEVTRRNIELLILKETF